MEQLVVNDSGRVSEVRVSDEAQANRAGHRYIDAVRAAAMQWTFESLEIDKWVDEADGTRHFRSREMKPFSVVYAFISPVTTDEQARPWAHHPRPDWRYRHALCPRRRPHKRGVLMT